MLYLISIGLWSIKDISLNGLEAIEKCDVIYFENYTSYYDSNLNDIKKIIFLSLPRTLALSAHQFSLLLLISLASVMTDGSIAVFNFSSIM